MVGGGGGGGGAMLLGQNSIQDCLEPTASSPELLCQFDIPLGLSPLACVPQVFALGSEPV